LTGGCGIALILQRPNHAAVKHHLPSLGTGSLPVDGLIAEGVHLKSLLNESAAGAEKGGAYVTGDRALDLILATKLKPHNGISRTVDEWADVEDTTEHTRLVNLLGNLTGRVAGYVVGDTA